MFKGLSSLQVNACFHFKRKKGQAGKDGEKLLEQMLTLQIPSGSSPDRE